MNPYENRQFKMFNRVLLLAPVNISSFRGKSANISTNKNDTSAHDDKKRLQCCVMLQTLDCEPLHAGGGVVQLPAPLAHQVGVVSGIQELGQKHLLFEGSKLQVYLAVLGRLS